MFLLDGTPKWNNVPFLSVVQPRGTALGCLGLLPRPGVWVSSLEHLSHLLVIQGGLLSPGPWAPWSLASSSTALIQWRFARLPVLQTGASLRRSWVLVWGSMPRAIFPHEGRKVASATSPREEGLGGLGWGSGRPKQGTMKPPAEGMPPSLFWFCFCGLFISEVNLVNANNVFASSQQFPFSFYLMGPTPTSISIIKGMQVGNYRGVK